MKKYMTRTAHQTTVVLTVLGSSCQPANAITSMETESDTYQGIHATEDMPGTLSVSIVCLAHGAGHRHIAVQRVDVAAPICLD